MVDAPRRRGFQVGEAPCEPHRRESPCRCRRAAGRHGDLDAADADPNQGAEIGLQRSLIERNSGDSSAPSAGLGAV